MEHSQLTKIFKALSNEQRLKLFLMIHKECKKEVNCGGMEKAFTQACDCFSLSKSTISHHIKELQNAGLIKTRRDGQSCFCEVNKTALKAVQSFLK